jgi:hypothetical protein
MQIQLGDVVHFGNEHCSLNRQLGQTAGIRVQRRARLLGHEVGQQRDQLRIMFTLGMNRHLGQTAGL